MPQGQYLKRTCACLYICNRIWLKFVAVRVSPVSSDFYASVRLPWSQLRWITYVAIILIESSTVNASPNHTVEIGVRRTPRTYNTADEVGEWLQYRKYVTKYATVTPAKPSFAQLRQSASRKSSSAPPGGWSTTHSHVARAWTAAKSRMLLLHQQAARLISDCNSATSSTAPVQRQLLLALRLLLLL